MILSVGSYSYKTAVWLNNVLKEFCYHSTIIKDFFEFIKKIIKISNLHQKTWVSFDVKSLFTNIPLNFALNLNLK